MAIQYLDLADFLLIGEAVLGVEAEVLKKAANLTLADSALNAPAADLEGLSSIPTSRRRSPSFASA